MMAFESFRADFGDASGSCSTTLSMDQENVTVKRLKENVMPLDLAIKRELDYRMRMENLRGVHADIRKAYVPFQIDGACNLGNHKKVCGLFQGPPPVPRPSIVGKKRKILSSSLRNFPTQRPSNSFQADQNDSGGLFCTLCQLGFSSKSALRQHRQDSIHKAKLLENQKKIRQSKNKPQWCKLCRISCSDERAFIQHLAGKKHAASVHAIEAAKSIKEDADKKAKKVNWDELEWDMVA